MRDRLPLGMNKEQTMHEWTAIKILLTLAFGAIAACSPERTCAPGSTQRCHCADGATGAQSCTTDGTRWDLCACAKPATEAPDGPVVQHGAVEPGALQRAATDIPESPNPASGQPLGGRCAVDRQCLSGECKGFKCVKKVGTKAPLGARCVVDGDCESLECKGFRCIVRN